MNPDARQFEARLRLCTRSLPVVLAGVVVFVAGYLTYQPPEQWQRSLELWGGLVFIGACLGATELFARFGLGLLGLPRLERKRSEEDSRRLHEATDGLAESGRPFYPALIDAGEAPLLIAAPGGRLIIAERLLRSVEPGMLRLLAAQALARLSMGVMLERILFTGAAWWIAGLTVLRMPLGLAATLAGAAATIVAQLFLQEWLYRRELKLADSRVADNADSRGLARAIAEQQALCGADARVRALKRIMALGLVQQDAEEIIAAAFGS